MSKVFVALSGGVDSAVAAHMLKAQGHDVVGVFIRVWQPDFIVCTQAEEEKAALRVAASLGIPFRRIDLSEEYKHDVVDDMIAEYSRGNTPNPDVLCNAHIKFGAFLAYAKSQGADKIATGHHARVIEENGVYKLKTGIDPAKDQSYFLWQLTQEELSYTYMPIGEYTKQEIREYATHHGIPSATKPDSQGLCFIGHVDMKTFLSHFIKTSRGDVVSEGGVVIGHHDGAAFVTIGQRGGFTITDKDFLGSTYYVIGKDMESNTVTVSKNQTPADDAHTDFLLRATSFTIPKESVPLESLACQTRYHGEVIPCRLIEKESEVVASLSAPTRVAKGQSIVFYENDVCLGGGVVA